VRNNCPRPAAAFMTFVLLSAAGLAQNNEVSLLSGEVQGAPELAMHGYVVALEELASHREFGHADVEPDGAFQFRYVPYGDYQLKIETYYGDVIQQAFVTVDSKSGPLAIQLARQVDARPPSGGIAAARLLHPPAKKALQAFKAAEKFSESGRFAEAARELERAIEISPGFADAYSNLGAQYIRLGRFEDAISEIARAIEIGKPNAVDLSNLACAQYALRRFGDALPAARAAVQADPSNVKAHYILGSLLARDRRTLQEAIPHLALAAESSQSARITLQQAQAALASKPQR